MALAWTREQDGDHYGRPVYDYHAAGHGGNRTYHIVWAIDAGFGYTARNDAGYLTDRWGIQWARTLKNCKAYCEEIERKHRNGAPPTTD
jgi:hypothetical protein